MKNKNLKIEYISVDKLNTASWNPRQLSSKERENIKKSLKEHDFAKPLVINATKKGYTILGGNQRYKVAYQDLNYKELPCVVLDISEEKAKALNLRLNKVSASWDWEALAEQFEVKKLMDVGFDDDELSKIWDDVLTVEDDKFDTEEELEKIDEPKSSLGDVYKLGKHRLICGDATKLEVVKQLTEDMKVNTIYNDPPFNINLDYDGGIGGNQNYGGNVDDNKDPEEYRNFLKKTIENSLAVADKNTHIFYYCDQNNIHVIQKLFREIGLKNRRVCLWVKNGINPTPHIAFNKSYEPCVYATKGKPHLNPQATKLSEILNKEIDTGNRTHDDIKDLWDIWLAKRKAGQEYKHSAHKPVSLHEKPIRRVTKPGDVILDLFGGSGSTLIAAEQMNRKCLMAEIEPTFVDLIISRYESFTGNEVKNIND